MRTQPAPKTLPASVRRKVAVEASCDPRTVDAVLSAHAAGEEITSLPRMRVLEALRRLKLIEDRA